MDEHALEVQFEAWCKSKNLPCLKLQLVNRRGWPDRTVLLPNGRIVLVELKRPDGKGRVSAQQRQWIDQLRSMRFVAIATHDLQEAIDTVLSAAEIL